MTLNKVLIDINICLDVILDRKLFVKHSSEIIYRCEEDFFTGMIAAHGFDTIFYVLTKEIGKEKAYKGIRYIRDVFDIANVTKDIIDDAMELNWQDFEDAIHYQAALAEGCDAIVSRDKTDFENTDLQVLSPIEFLDRLSAGE